MASILASRTVNHKLLKDDVWDRSFVECGPWVSPQLKFAFQNAGYSPAENQEHIFGKNIIDVPTVNASVLLHNAHSCQVELGHFYNIHKHIE